MDRNLEKERRERAVELGKSGNPDALPELIELSGYPAANVRRLAASAIDKLAGFADSFAAVPALQPMLQDHFPQGRQYAAKALGAWTPLTTKSACSKNKSSTSSRAKN